MQNFRGFNITFSAVSIVRPNKDPVQDSKTGDWRLQLVLESRRFGKDPSLSH